MKKIIVRLVGIVNIVVILMMVMVGYSGKIDPLVHSYWASTGIIFPIFLIINLVFLVVWIFFHWKGCWLPVLGYVLCYVPIRTYIPFNPPSSPPEGAIKVLSYNVMGYAIRDMSEGEINQISEYIAETKADIACLQESGAWGKWGNKIDSLLQAVYPYHDYMPHPGKSPDHLTLYSQYPIVSREQIPYDSGQNFSMAYVLNVEGEHVLVVNNHFESNKLSYGDKDVFGQMVHGKLSNDSAKTESRMLFGKLAEALKKRAPQADAVAAYIKKYLDKGMSVIVCGDFNDNPISYTRQKVAEGLTDCYVSAGNGPGFTYHLNSMYVRIDYIFCSEDWKPYACKVERKVAQSDHYPIVCWLKKRSKP